MRIFMVNVIAEHVEYLLRVHDCVVVPGFGAFLCNYEAAHFDERRRDVILPPARHLAFNRMIADSDGLLAWSVSKRDGVSFEEASVRVGELVDALWHELEVFGEAAFGRLGTFYRSNSGVIEFEAAPLPSVNGVLYGLRALALLPVMVDDAQIVETYADEPGNRAVILPVGMKLRAYATGVVASLAVVVTAVLLMVSPIRIDKEMRQAALAPVPKTEQIKAVDGDVNAMTDERLLDADDMCLLGMSADVLIPGLHSEEVAVETVESAVADHAEVAYEDEKRIAVEPAVGGLRFNDDDVYCVVVASFPSKQQAEQFISEKGVSRHLAILEKDSKYRVYAATGDSYASADRQRLRVGQDDAWICRR